MTDTKVRRIKPRIVDPRVAKSIAARMIATGKVSGDIEGAITDLIANRVIPPKVYYKATTGVYPAGGYTAQVGDLIAWDFNVDDGGSGKVWEVVKIVKRNQHSQNIWPHYGKDEVEALSLTTGKIETV